MQALPYLILGVCLTVGISLAIGGCVMEKNAYALFEIIPAIVVAIAGTWYMNKEDDYSEDDIVTHDVLIWTMLVGTVSIFALPSVLYHCRRIVKGGALALNIIGCLVIVGGIIGIQFINREDEFTRI